MKMRATVTIKGLVQGVAFRRYTVEQANRLKVAGWVKNLANGDVQGCFEGDTENVTALIDWCRKGPPRARVDKVTVEQDSFRGEFDDFDIRY